MTRSALLIIVAVCLLITCADAFGIQRFPPPDFETGHQLPGTTEPGARSEIFEYVDAAVLLIALSLASWLILKKRNRRWIFMLMLFSLGYFGFYREGCVCPIGAIGNFTLSVFDSDYAMPLGALIFFVAPLVFTLFFGRSFCGAVCPMGAIQDLVLVRPVKVPRGLEQGLRLFAYLYLGLAVLFAATGRALLICRYDPFVAMFRLSGSLNMLVIGACFLIVGIFIGRPYCRFVCPYGVILRQFSRLAKKRAAITPDDCIKCRLCEDSCPFGAINEPEAPWPEEVYKQRKKTLALLIGLLPVLMLLGGWVLGGMSDSTAKMHARVRLAEQIYMEEAGLAQEITDPSSAFRGTGEQVADLYAEAAEIRGQFAVGGWFVGGFLGLIAGLKLIRLSVKKSRKDYEADRAGCLACGRCFSYCPRDHVRIKELKAASG